MKINDFISCERPRERCLLLGAETLSVRECLAIIIGSGPRGKGCLGLANHILKTLSEGESEEFLEQNFFRAVNHDNLENLKMITGMGNATLARILVTAELCRRYFLYKGRGQQNKKPDFNRLTKIVLSKVDTFWRSYSREWIGFVPVLTNNEVGNLNVVEQGVRTHVNFEVKEFFARLLASRPQAFYLFHNHPSGLLTPSPEDVELTNHIFSLAEGLGVNLLGHFIVSSGDEYLLDVR